jgi:hypothetical protein
MAASIENNLLGEEVGLDMRNPVISLVQPMSSARIFIEWRFTRICASAFRDTRPNQRIRLCATLNTTLLCIVLSTSLTQENHHDTNID